MNKIKSKILKYKFLKKHGATLVDTLIGVFIFSIVIAAGIAGLRYSSQIRSSQDENALANTIMTYIVEDLWARSFSYISTESSNLSSYYSDGGSKEHTNLNDLDNNNINVQVTEVETGLLKIEVTLSWDATVGTSSPQTVKIYRSDVDMD